MKKPIIGITASHDAKNTTLSLRINYCNAIREAGGIPIVLPLELSEEEAEQLSYTLDGVLFSGGPDVHPFLFGEETLEACGEASILRDNLELSLFHRVYRRRKPILGICRGVQMINIALGGNIYQDIGSQFQSESRLAHQQPFQYQSPSHKIYVTENSRLAEITGTSVMEVNSIHHQAVKETAPGLQICGRSSDGLTEALEMPDYPFLIGVQWHPEYLYEHCPHANKLFHAFTDACRSEG